MSSDEISNSSNIRAHHCHPRLLLNNGWTDENELLILNLSERASELKTLHSDSFSFYNGIHQFIGFVLVISSAILGIQTQIQLDALIIRLLTLLFALIVAIQSYLNYGARAAEHSGSSRNFMKLHQRIQQALSSYRRERTEASQFVRENVREYHYSTVASPNISSIIFFLFKRRFKDSKIDSSEDFYLLKGEIEKANACLQDIRDHDVSVMNIDTITNLNKYHTDKLYEYEYGRFIQIDK